MSLKLTRKNAIITGASKGIRKDIAFALAREGVNIAAYAWGQEALESTAKELKDLGIDVFSKVCDVGKRASIS